MAFSRKIWGGRGGHGLDAVMARLRIGMDGGRRHDARGDVRALAEAVRRMWAQLNSDYHTCPVECGTGVLPEGTGAC
jgi:DNA polymerase III epsilon subunit-like protein